MTKHAATCKNMADGCEQEDVEEETTTSGSNARTVRTLTGEATTSGSDVRTVRKLTGETPGTQSIWDVTGTVMEERRVEDDKRRVKDLYIVRFSSALSSM